MAQNIFGKMGRLSLTAAAIKGNRVVSPRLLPLGSWTLRNTSFPQAAGVNYQCMACFATSKKSGDTGAVTADSVEQSLTKTDIDPSNVSGKKKYWRTYGFDWHDEEKDKQDANLVMFSTVTVLFVGFSFVLIYFPDHRLKDWAQREAYIEIAKREALGLPHIDPNLVSPDKINLPTEEELGDYEIII